MKYSLLLTILIFIIHLPLSSTDRDIALVYQKKIWDVINLDKDQARILLDSAFTYDRNISGLWYAQGVLQQEANALVSAVDAYERAMELDDWEGADFDTYLEQYFSLLYRLGLWEKILASKDRLGYYRVNNRQVLLSSGWADFFLGNEKSAVERAARGINLYPGDTRFYTLHLACGVDQKVLDSFLYYWGKSKEDLYTTVYTLNKLKRLPEKLEEYYILEAKDDLSRFLELKKSLLKKKSTPGSLTQFLENQEDYDLDLLWEIFDLTNTRGKELIEKSLLNFSGNYYSDHDGDFHKELILDRNRELRIDRNRDGLFETRLNLSETGLPQVWMSESASETVREITLYTWPLVKEVKRQNTLVTQSFQFLYPRFNLDQEGLSSYFYDKGIFSLMTMMRSLEGKDLSIPLEILLDNCYSMQEVRDERLSRIYLFHHGEILGIEEDSQGDGIFDRQILMSGGEIEAARRDLDGDGKYDLFEYYEMGIWKGYAINLNGKAWSDFYHDWSVIPLKIWDFEKDHIINSYSLDSGKEKILEPQLRDVIGLDDLLFWEKKFEAQWYR